MNKLRTPDLVGRWPAPGERIRREKRFVRVKPDERLCLIHGKKNHILFSMFVSNDVIHAGEMMLPAGAVSDPEVHKGDEGIYVTKGILTVLVSEQASKKKLELKKSFEIRENQAMLIPEGVAHRYFNFTSSPVSVFFTVAPSL